MLIQKNGLLIFIIFLLFNLICDACTLSTTWNSSLVLEIRYTSNYTELKQQKPRHTLKHKTMFYDHLKAFLVSILFGKKNPIKQKKNSNWKSLSKSICLLHFTYS